MSKGRYRSFVHIRRYRHPTSLAHSNTRYAVHCYERVLGQQLSKLLANMSEDEIDSITGELKLMMEEMRRLRITDLRENQLIGYIGREPFKECFSELGMKAKARLRRSMKCMVISSNNTTWYLQTIFGQSTADDCITRPVGVSQ